jgi:hypothetical protein
MTLGKALFSIKIIRILSKIWITWAQTKTQYQQNKTIPFSIQQTLALNQWQKDYKYIPYLSKKFGNDLYHVVSHFVFFHFNFSRKKCPLFSSPPPILNNYRTWSNDNVKADSERENYSLPQLPWKGFTIQWILRFIEKNMNFIHFC